MIARLLADPGTILLWDLDGTILDTSKDIASGVNGALADLGLPALPLDVVVSHVGRGVRVLMERSLESSGRLAAVDGPAAVDGLRAAEDPPVTGTGLVPASGADDRVATAVSLFRRHYAAHLLDTTRPYGELDRTLRTLAAQGRRMAVVSNKPEDATRALLKALDLEACFLVALGGDSLPERKPSPAPVRQAIRLCAAAKDPALQPVEAVKPVEAGEPLRAEEEALPRAVLIGDSEIDVQTAQAAGIPVCLVRWGFDPDGRARALGPEGQVETPEELDRLLLG